VPDQIDQAADDLRNEKAGWVTRRDAADFLGQAAAKAVVVLREFQDEVDLDVRRSVGHALAQASAALEGIPPQPPVAHYSLAELAHACEKGDERTVRKEGDGYIVEVHLDSGRRQQVSLTLHKKKDGPELLRVLTICGKANEKAYGWALRANMQLRQSALALVTEEGEERFAVTNCFLASEATPREVKSSVKETAYYGDWLEAHLNETDAY
jgi:predicted nucleic acid-binding protein